MAMMPGRIEEYPHRAGGTDYEQGGPFELLPHEGLVLYDVERSELERARQGGTDDLETLVGREGQPLRRRADVLAHALEALGRLRARRLEEIGEEARR
jgi:hypothetical protein